MQQSLVLLDVPGLLASQAEGVQIVDLRAPVIYAREHVPDTINIPFTRRGFADAAQQVLDPQRPVALIGDNQPLAGMAQTELQQVGYHVVGSLDGGLEAWKQTGRPTAAIPQITVDQLAARIDTGNAPRLLDVRETWEFEGGHIPGAEAWPLSQFADRFAELPKDQPLVFVCASGARSGSVVAFLYRLGYRNAANLIGGMNIWQGAGRPVA